jgi:hypothetical protein
MTHSSSLQATTVCFKSDLGCEGLFDASDSGDDFAASTFAGVGERFE